MSAGWTVAIAIPITKATPLPTVNNPRRKIVVHSWPNPLTKADSDLEVVAGASLPSATLDPRASEFVDANGDEVVGAEDDSEGWVGIYRRP
ncbi:MAG: hypothetical protein F6K16_35315 [Symploca sp. SIO2B6]|nr:hypothetical protein [Symploca sp. SIO2B6]